MGPNGAVVIHYRLRTYIVYLLGKGDGFSFIVDENEIVRVRPRDWNWRPRSCRTMTLFIPADVAFKL